MPAVRTQEGFRALDKDRPANPASVQRYLESKFGESLAKVIETMKRLAESLASEDLAREAYSLYEKFRPAVPAGKKGWGPLGVLDLSLIRSLAAKGRR